MLWLALRSSFGRLDDLSKDLVGALSLCMLRVVVAVLVKTTSSSAHGKLLLRLWRLKAKTLHRRRGTDTGTEAT